MIIPQLAGTLGYANANQYTSQAAPQAIRTAAPKTYPPLSPAALAAVTSARQMVTQMLDPNKAYVRIGPFVFEVPPNTSDTIGSINTYRFPQAFTADTAWLTDILCNTWEQDDNGTIPKNRGTFWNAGGNFPQNPLDAAPLMSNTRIPTQMWPQDYLDQYRAWMTALGVGNRDYYLPYISTVYGAHVPADFGSGYADLNNCWTDVNRMTQIWYGTPVGKLLNPADNKWYTLAIGLGGETNNSLIYNGDNTKRCWFDSCRNACVPGAPTPKMVLHAWLRPVHDEGASWWQSIKGAVVDLVSDACWLIDQKWFQAGVKVVATAEGGPGTAAEIAAGMSVASSACSAAFPAPNATTAPVEGTTPGGTKLVLSPATMNILQMQGKILSSYPTGSVTRFNKSRKVWVIYKPASAGLGDVSPAAPGYTAPTPPAGMVVDSTSTTQPGGVPVVGTESDVGPFYTRWWFWVGIGTVAAGGSFYVYRRRKQT